MKPVYIFDAIRTPIGKYGGSLSRIRPDDLLALVIKELLQRNSGIDINLIEDVIAGDANQAGEDNRNVARMAALLAGLPVSVAGNTVNRLCASGLQAIMDASRAIANDEGTVYIAGGVESMSRAPFVLAKNETPFSRKPEMYDTTIGWRFINPKLSEKYYPFSMGETAENVAEQWHISRETQDEFAFNSQQKYYKALEFNKWKDEIVTVQLPSLLEDQPVWFAADEQPRQSSLEKLSKLKPVFKTGGSVTAGNSSAINDGAAAIYLCDEAAIKNFDIKPMARVVSMAVSGVDPSIMGIGPVSAINKALTRAGISLKDVDLFEINEAFASQSIACIRELNIDPQKVNVNGGAIAIGHPLGCSGVRISTTLLYEMKRRNNRYGIAAMCVGVGQGAAILYENLKSGNAE